MYISTPPSHEVENFQMKIYYPAGDRTPDLLNQRQTCYHLSQRGELMYQNVKAIILQDRRVKVSVVAHELQLAQFPVLPIQF